MQVDKRISILIGTLLLLVPVTTFLGNTNLPQIPAADILLIITSQLVLLTLIIIASLVSHRIFSKNFLNIGNFFLLNFFIVYLFFFFKNIKNVIFFEFSDSTLDEFFTLIIFIIIYFLLIYFNKKIIKFLTRFLSIYIFAMFFIFLLNIFQFESNSEKKDFTNMNLNNLSNFNLDLINKNLNQTNIFLIVLDGMINLEYAEKLKIIENKKSVEDYLKKDDYIYKDNFFSNYDVSYLSIASLLQSSYPVVEESRKYNNRKNFFPFFILNEKKENNFFNILKKTKKNFFWLGNEWFFCKENLYINCLNEDPVYKKISRLKLFYSDSIYIYLLNYYSPKKIDKEALNFLINPNLKLDKLNQNGNIFLIHALSPHPPFIFNQDCEIKDQTKNISTNEEIKYYTYAYNCLLKILSNFTKIIEKKSEHNMFFVLGDHGWSFEKRIMNKVDLNPREARFKPFFSYKIPTKCKNISSPDSIVNVLRFALMCDGNKNLNYLEDIKFKSFYENDKDYGKVFIDN